MSAHPNVAAQHRVPADSPPLRSGERLNATVGHEITTVEGLASHKDNLHSLQQFF